MIAALIAILPVQIPGYAALTPALALMAVYHWTIYRPDLLPPIAAVRDRSGEDLLTGRLVGVGALMLLVTRAVVLRSRRHFVGTHLPVLSGPASRWSPAARCSASGPCIACSNPNLFDPRNTIFRIGADDRGLPGRELPAGRTQRALIDGPRLMRRR